MIELLTGTLISPTPPKMREAEARVNKICWVKHIRYSHIWYMHRNKQLRKTFINRSQIMVLQRHKESVQAIRKGGGMGFRAPIAKAGKE